MAGVTGLLRSGRAFWGAHLQIFAEMEPNVPWTLPMMRFRAACYAAHASPLRASAEADVARFTDAAPQAFGELLE